MRWFRGAFFLGLGLLAFGGCGSSAGEDELVLSFERFDDENIEQADSVSAANAEVDVCQGLCQSSGGGGEITFEDFTETLANAVFVNRGKADIRLESYTVEVVNSGLPILNRTISANIPGGRCVDGQTACADDFECLGGICVRQETSVPILLYDLEFKKIAVDGQCPLDFSSDEILTGGNVIPRNYEVVVTFNARDLTDERRTISAGHSATFANFDNCEDQ